MIFLLFTLLLFGCSYSALAKAAKDNTIDSFAQSALTSTSEANAFPEYFFTDEATPNSNPSIPWVNPSSSDLLPEALPKPADINSFTSSKSLCQGRTQTNGKLRIRDQSESCISPYSQITSPPSYPPFSPFRMPPIMDQTTKKSGRQSALRMEPSRNRTEKMPWESRIKLCQTMIPWNARARHFLIPVCCLGSIDLMDLMVEGQTVFDQVESCVSCKLVSFSLTRRLGGFGFIVIISQLADNAVLHHT